MSSQGARQCASCKAEFTIEPEDFAFYDKIQVPPPTWCPDCRLKRRLAWRNERGFYRTTCQRCHKPTISVYPPDCGLVVYCRPCWWSDEWDGLEYGVDFDPAKPFLLQLKELLYRVPIPDLFGLYTTLENSEYTNMVGFSKNCYFLTMADWNENCGYSSNVYHCKDSYESLMLDGSELCYETVNCRQCFRTRYSIDCTNCQNVSFSRNCIGSQDLIGCVNLRGKQYCIFNEQYSKEEYELRAKDLQPTTREKVAELKRRATELWLKHPNRFIHEFQSQDVTGDYIANSKNVRDVYMVQEMENSRYCALVLPGKTSDCYDHTHYGISAELLYETLQVGNQASRVRWCWFAILGVTNVDYSMWIIGGNNIFGCVGLKKQEYCILNKQYSHAEYDRLSAEIVKQMDDLPYVDALGREYRYGEFFPSEFSPVPYNVTIQEYFPSSKEEAIAQGFTWRDVEPSRTPIQIRADALPTSLGSAEAVQQVVGRVIECAHQGSCADQCAGAFTIIGQEAAFLLEQQLPVPDVCPNCRHFQRVRQRSPLQLHQRICQCAGARSGNGVYTNTSADHSSHAASESCPNQFTTTFSPDRPEIVYCDDCYLKEVV